MSNDFQHAQTDILSYKDCRDQFKEHLSKHPNLLNALCAVSETIFPGGNKGGYWYINYLFKFYNDGQKLDSEIPVQKKFIEALNEDPARSSLIKTNTLI